MRPRSLLGRIGRLLGRSSPQPPGDSDEPFDDEPGQGATLTDEEALEAARQATMHDPLRQDLVGGRHTLAYLRHLARGNTIRRKAFFDTIDEQHPPVLLIHGFMGTRGSMFLLERRMNQDGICVFSFNLGPINTRDIRRSAVLIHRKIEAILAQTSLKKIDIVGHSMGGLIGLYYVKKLGGHDKVRKLVMMGTPILGTWSAIAGIATLGLLSASSWQILPRSPFLAELAEGPLPKQVEYYTIAAQRDWVCPPNSTFLDGATRLTVPLGHSSLVVSEDVYQHVRRALRDGAAQAADVPGVPSGQRGGGR